MVPLYIEAMHYALSAREQHDTPGHMFLLFSVVLDAHTAWEKTIERLILVSC